MPPSTTTMETTTLADTHLQDVGLADDHFYKSHLHPLVYTLRSFLRPYIDYELPFIERVQSYHNTILTWYFLLTSNVGSHTFYVIMLPLPVWLGNLELARDLVSVLGLGIYFTGFVKDLLSLPRPRSPPIKRLTMSHYTAKEYGCPSSHSANATAVTIILFLHTMSTPNVSPILYSLFFLYWFSLIAGRIYCGMHGLVDIITGCLIGLFTVVLRLSTKQFHDLQILTSTSPVLTPLLLSVMYYAFIYFHPIPLEGCPCYEDSVAFIAVLMGLDLGYWSLSRSTPYLPLSKIYPTHVANIPYSFADFGITFTVLRVLVGVILVVAWKSFAKPASTKLIHLLRNEDPKMGKITTVKCFANIPRTDTRIFVKCIVYAGIPIVVIYTKFLLTAINL